MLLKETISTNDITTDVDIQYKLTPKLRLKGYNKANDKLKNNNSPYTQGVGISYNEEFDSFGELFNRYINKIKNLFKKKKKKDNKTKNKTNKKK